MISSPALPFDRSPRRRRRPPGPSRRRQPDAHRPLAVQPGAAGDDGRLGRAVGVPDLAAVVRQAGAVSGGHASPPRISRRTAAERLGRPQRDQRRHRGDHRDVVGLQPRTHVHAAADQRPGSRAPGSRRAPRPATSPRTRRRRRPRARPSPGRGAERAVLEEHPGLGVDERRRGPVRDRDALGGAGRARGEDDPRVVVGVGSPASRGAERRRRSATARSLPTIAATSASPKTSRARSSGSSASTGT